MMSLREEFEPLLISDAGYHGSPELCKLAWDEEEAAFLSPERQEKWEREMATHEIANADAWLRLVTRTEKVNERAGSSYGLKHRTEEWHHKAGRWGYCSNGHFLMAAKRLGFKMRPYWSHYYVASGTRWDCFNAYLNVSRRGLGEISPGYVGDLVMERAL
jgi:hypothetical protein